MKRYVIVWLLLLIGLPACSLSTSQTVNTPSPPPTQTATSRPIPTEALSSTSTTTPTIEPTNTPRPTREPTPTRTPNIAATATKEYNDEAIREAFEQYRKALLAGDGELALEVVSSTSIEWYEQVLFDAVNLDREGLDELDITEKFLVLRFRHEFNLERLESLTGEEVIILSVEQGWIGSEGIAELEIDEVDIASLPSSAYVTFKGVSPADGLFFRREEGQFWKVSLLNVGSDELFEQLLEDSGLTEDEFMVAILEVLSGRIVDERIFDGPLE